jgi:hypothetical protein
MLSSMTVHLNTSPQPTPAVFSAVPTFSIICLACASKAVGSLPSGPIPSAPDK